MIIYHLHKPARKPCFFGMQFIMKFLKFIVRKKCMALGNILVIFDFMDSLEGSCFRLVSVTRGFDTVWRLNEIHDTIPSRFPT